jgi:outer membrane protein OmpA-like peptidoglycan-associated protein
LNLQQFQPSMDSKGLISLNASQVLQHLDPSLGMVLSWAKKPLDLSGQQQASLPSRTTVEHLLTTNLQLALGLLGALELGLDLPLSFWKGQSIPGCSGASNIDIDGQGASDVMLQLKVRLLNTSSHALGLALYSALSLPTGNSDAFLGTGQTSLAPSLILDRDWLHRRLQLVLNLGARFQLGDRATWTDSRTCGTGQQISSGHQLLVGAGVSLALVPGRLQLMTELVARSDLGQRAGPDQPRAAAELSGGIRLHLARRSFLTLALGRGLRGSDSNFRYGSPDLRALIGITFEPAIGDQDQDGIKDDLDRCPRRPEDRDDFEDRDGCPDPDNDRDGILDRDDRCPNEPEDRDGHDDADGCPESEVRDRDGDGIADDHDRCPDDPEDNDGFEDKDGCPDPDNDNDRILDTDDLCPNEPEDKDSFEDKDGCPDPDNDNDQVLDRDDRCPNEPETINGYLDADGCPDKRPFSAHRWRLDVLKKIHFETNSATIRQASTPILDAIAFYLKESPAVLLVEIQGHADERGSLAYNLRLTADRASAVKRYLIQHGVPSSRLRARGYGEARPLDRGHSPGAWSKNRRVEFVILKRGP